MLWVYGRFAFYLFSFSVVFTRQILTYKDGTHTERVKDTCNASSRNIENSLEIINDSINAINQ